jgi:hypothetical protein
VLSDGELFNPDAVRRYALLPMDNHQLGTMQTGGEISAVAAVYNRHMYVDEMHEAVALWERRLASLLSRDHAFVRVA